MRRRLTLGLTPRMRALNEPKVRACMILGAIVGITGCGDSSGAPPRVTVYEVKGQVLLSDGRPLSGGHVYFVSKQGAMDLLRPLMKAGLVKRVGTLKTGRYVLK